MILKVQNITKSFGKKKVLNNVSFEMNGSLRYGIVGENGSGKSTLLKIIVGEWKPDRGNISVEGQLGYCPQKALLFSQLTVDENLMYFASAYGVRKADLLSRSDLLMNYFNFKKFRAERVSGLSGGTQQKLNLSIALLHKPKLLILDEPYNGFDWDTYIKFWDYTDQLKKEGCAVLIVTHFLSEKERFDRIFNLNEGELS